MGNLMEALREELNRNKELLEHYKMIPTGFFGASMIQVDIKFAEEAIDENNIIKIVQAYEKLKNNE